MKLPKLVFPCVATLSLLLPTAAISGTIKGKIKCGEICENLVLYVKDVPGEWSGEGKVVTLDQKGKTYIPHVLPILKGTTVRLKNADPELHNVHAYQNKVTVFNVALPPIPDFFLDMKSFRKPGTYVMLCDVHAEMSAYVVVLENPSFTKPDKDGLYEIGKVPPGTYTLVKYDPEGKTAAERRVEISDTGATVDF